MTTILDLPELHEDTPELLEQARSKENPFDGILILLAEEARWIRGANARAVDGHVILPESPDAVCWCAQGAAITVVDYGAYDPETDVDSDGITRIRKVLEALGKAMVEESIGLHEHWNFENEEDVFEAVRDYQDDGEVANLMTAVTFLNDDVFNHEMLMRAIVRARLAWTETVETS